MATLHAYLLGRFRFCSDGDAVSGLEGAKVQELIEKVYATPANIVERAKAAVKP